MGYTLTRSFQSSARHARPHRPPQLIASFTTGEAIIADTLSRQQLGVTLMLIFGATALVLAAIGIYGVMADRVAQRSGSSALNYRIHAVESRHDEG